MLNELRRKYQSLEVWVLDKVSHEKIMELHKESWVLIIPSITEEPLPYVVVEAITLGTIPVASKVGGIPEITIDTPAENFLFVPGNIDELINKIKMVMSWPREKIISIGIRLKEHATKLFDSKEINSRILRVFNSD
ncbi:MAG: glycosyltransferase [Desulfurococcaceae archaeon]|nr:glycosyltransferase [Desulfurococcaceae archaeon]